jgi:hypothetical protein
MWVRWQGVWEPENRRKSSKIEKFAYLTRAFPKIVDFVH